MKRIFFAALLLCSATLHAQVTITYERKQNMHRTVQNEEMKAMIPEFRTAKYELLLQDSISVYRAIVEQQSADFDNDDEGGGRRRIVFGGGPGGADNGFVYKNTASSKLLEQRELGGKTFLIIDTLKPMRWKLSEETKTILGYTCKKATMTRDSVTTVVWYAPQLAGSVGPDFFGGLPGLILEVNHNNSLIIFTAKEVKASVDATALKEPTKGNKVTRAQYREKQMQLMENMRRNFGGGGRNVIIQ